MDYYSNNSIMFTHSVIGDRWSHAVYTSWWTGLPPMNMLGFSVKGDQLLESIARAEGRRCKLGWDSIEDPKPEASEGGNQMYSFQYTGTLWAPIDVGGGRNRSRLCTALTNSTLWTRIMIRILMSIQH